MQSADEAHRGGAPEPPVRSISVLMPILNGEPFLGRVLEGLAAQKCSVPWDFMAADCGSTDRTLEIFAEHARTFPVPLRVHGIHRSEFNHGDTRNVLAALCEGELLVFVTDDSIPVGTDWLETFAANFTDPEVAGAYLRNTPRPEADILAKVFSEFDPGYQAGRQVTTLPDPEVYDALDGNARRVLYNFNNTSSAVRRSFWERHPFPHLDFGEDIMLCRAMLEAGCKVVYDDRAVIHHSHEYGPEDTYVRAKVDGAFNAERLDRVCLQAPEEIEIQTGRQVERDREALEAQGYAGADLEREVERAAAIRRAYFQGLHEGGCSPKRFRMSTALPDPQPRICLVGVPEELERALEARGWELVDDRADAVVLHVHGDDEAARACLAAAVADRQPTLWTVDPGWSERIGMKKALMAADELVDPARVAVAPDEVDFGPRPAQVPLEAWVWRGDAELRALRGDGAQRVTDASDEVVRVVEVRYRALANRARSHRQVDLKGTDAVRTEGAVRVLDESQILIQVEGGAAEWDLSAASPGRRELRIYLTALADEIWVQLGGQVFLDGEHVGNLGPYRSSGGDETRVLRIPVVVGAGPRVLRLQSGFGSGGEGTLRVARVMLVDPAVPPAGESFAENSFDLRGQDARMKGRGAVPIECDMAQLGGQRGTLQWSLRGVEPGLHEVRFWLFYGEGEVHLQQSGRILVDGAPVASFGPIGPPSGGGHREVAVLVDLRRPDLSVGLTNTLHPLGPPSFCRVKRVLVRPVFEGAPTEVKPLQWLTRRPAHVEPADPLAGAER